MGSLMRISKKDRELIKAKFGGKCAYCGCDLPEKGWHADHVAPCLRRMEVVPVEDRKNRYAFELRHNGEFIRPEANRLDNMFPACAPCNLFKSSFSLELFRSEISKQAERAMKTSVNHRTAMRFGLIVETGIEVEFWFEKFNRSLESVNED